MTSTGRYSPEVRERAVRRVLEHKHEHSSEWAAIVSIAEKIGCSTEALRRWLRRTEIDAGQRVGLTTDERARFKELERENGEPTRSFAKPPRFSPRRSSTADRNQGLVHR